MSIIELSESTVQPLLDTPAFDPEQMGAPFWYEQYVKQREENQRLRQGFNYHLIVERNWLKY